MSNTVKNVLFVCTGNTCRSPMAEQFANSWLIRNDLIHQFRVISRALTDKYEPPNSPASSHGVEILAKEFSLDLSSHRSSMLTLQEVNDAKIIIGVTELRLDTYFSLLIDVSEFAFLTNYKSIY